LPKSIEMKYKQVLILRADLHMSPGKAAAQAAHAAVSALEIARKTKPEWVKAWLNEGQRKIVLKVKSKDEIVQLKKEADLRGLPNAIIEDMGLTELPPGTITALGIGPAPADLIDPLTRHLKLY